MLKIEKNRAFNVCVKLVACWVILSQEVKVFVNNSHLTKKAKHLASY